MPRSIIWLFIGAICIYACAPSPVETGKTEQKSSSMQARAADAPAELDEFAFLIGCFRLETSMRDQTSGDWSGIGDGQWRGRWVLGGWAIYDEWANIPFPGWMENMGRGSNTRIYDSKGHRFVLAWAHTNLQESRDRRARRLGEQIIVWQPSPEFVGFGWEARFEIGENGRWTRVDVTAPVGTEDWTEIRKIEAYPENCSSFSW